MSIHPKGFIKTAEDTHRHSMLLRLPLYPETHGQEVKGQREKVKQYIVGPGTGKE